MKILITGGAGYLGTELVKSLSKDENISEIIIYDNLARKNYNLFITATKLSSKIRVVDAELLDSRTLRKEVKNSDVVYHLAAKVSTPHADQDPHLFEQTNHWGTAELTYALEDSGVKKIIFASSASVYGAGDKSYTEEDHLNPRTFYAISKMRAEKQLRRLTSKLDTYIFRLGNIYGYSPSVRFDAVINKFMLNAHLFNKIDVHGDGNQKRAFIQIEKASKVLHNALYDGLKPGTYNVAEGNYSIKEIVNHLKRLYPDLETKYINQHLQLRNLTIEASPELKSLGWIDKTELEEELRKFQTKFALSPNEILVES